MSGHPVPHPGINLTRVQVLENELAMMKYYAARCREFPDAFTPGDDDKLAHDIELTELELQEARNA